MNYYSADKKIFGRSIHLYLATPLILSNFCRRNSKKLVDFFSIEPPISPSQLRQVYIVRGMSHTRKKVTEVHCWGGFGSQLFAVALIYDLKLRFPNRHYGLVLHSSGVTKRVPEITNLPFSIEFRVVDDFSAGGKSGTLSKPRNIFKSISRRLALSTGVLASADNDREYQNIKSWAKQIRGHYSRRSISHEFLIDLEAGLNSQAWKDSPSLGNLTVHYRLGDLLSLAEKSPIDDFRLAKEIARVQENQPGKITLFSDSPNVALELLGRYGIDSDITHSNLKTLDVLNVARQSNYFIGTSSKISYWIICLRKLRGDITNSSMPATDLANLTPLIGEEAAKAITYY